MVHVGATDAPVTIDETEEVMDEMADNGVESCDILGWEWEMGLHDTIGENLRFDFVTMIEIVTHRGERFRGSEVRVLPAQRTDALDW